MKKIIPILAVALGVFLLDASAFAGSPAGVSLSADKSVTYTAPRSDRVASSPAAQADPGRFKELYSTFNSDQSNLYDCCTAWTISTTQSLVGSQQFIAMPFTPARRALVHRVQLGLSYFAGTNSLSVSLNADDNGVPGKVLRSFTVSGIPPGGSCCDIEAVTPKAYPVRGGKTYWVVVEATADTWGGWNLDNTNQAGTFAFDTGSGWQATSGTLGAFRVMGL